MTEAGRLSRSFFEREVVDVARDLIGCKLWTNSDDVLTCGVIVETEAYAGDDDPASHAARLKTGRVLSMSGQPGIAYIYRSYGIHTMLNIVAELAGSSAAVLIRSLEPIAGFETMRRRRGIEDVSRFCRGPGTLTIAMGIGLHDHGADVVDSDWIWIDPPDRLMQPAAGERIGIRKGRDRPWRFFVADSPFVSAHRRTMTLHSRT